MKILKSIKELKDKSKKLYTIRIDDSEKKLIMDKAKKYTDGNVSAYIRFAAVNFEPKKRDLVEH